MRLGTLVDGGLAPAIMAIVDRGVQRHPGQARALRLEVELQMEESYPPVRIVFGDDGVVVEDGPAPAPGLRIIGTLPDLAALMVAPLVGGLPIRSTRGAAPHSGCSPRGGCASRAASGHCAGFWKS